MKVKMMGKRNGSGGLKSSCLVETPDSAPIPPGGM